jgi:hypothetical protein
MALIPTEFMECLLFAVRVIFLINNKIMRGLVLFLLTFISISLYSQDIVQVSIGSNYSNQVYYNLADDASSMINNNNWDLAIAQTASFEAGIHVNESVTISFVGSSPSTLLYLAPTSNFEDAIDMEMVVDSLYNDELSWANGAFNVPRDTNDFADFGWGVYNTNNHAIEGNRVFVIKLRDDSYRKFMVQSLIGGVYTLKYANLDGSDEQMVTIDKGDYEGKPLILFSFLAGGVLNDLPETYDLIFQRYSDLDPTNAGVMIEYTVTGIVTAPGVLSAQANNIEDPETTDFQNYLDSLDQQIDIIGQDWKFFSFESGWNIREDVTFFIKTRDDHLWQIYIYDFEGSSTGTYTFAKWDHGVIAGVVDMTIEEIDGLSIVPNPVRSNDHFSLLVESKLATEAQINIVNQQGQQIKSYSKSLNNGLNAFEISTDNMAAGIYYLQLRTPTGQISQAISVK